jgi:hypothetical protein
VGWGGMKTSREEQKETMWDALLKATLKFKTTRQVLRSPHGVL